jgi:CHRD domain
MKTKVLGLIAICTMAATSFAPMTSEAAPLTFEAILSGANEVPPTASTGTGLAVIVLDPTAQTIQISATFSGLTSNDVAAHIHCCGPLGTNFGVATTVPAFSGFPLGVTSGTYTSPTFDLTQALIYNPAFVTLEGGIAAAEAALIAGIEGGQTYFNIHTTTSPGGEIRGQLSAVPLPAALPLFATGLGALGLLGWRRKRKNVAAITAA